MDKSKTDQQVEDGTFLSDNFGVAPQVAARLVARDGVPPDAVDEKIRKARHNGDSSADDLVVDNDETRHKPVLHGPNKRAGGG